MAPSEVESIAWPRKFQMVQSTGSSAAKFWSHELYRGPGSRPVQILYSRTKMESEEIAHEFLDETVIGFDMEWPWQKKGDVEVPLQQRIGLIQIASEDKIALFHIGLHPGQAPKEILAPTLRRIIESEDITKTGVGVLNADFSRLQKWFGLAPKGAFELSHLHNLVNYGFEHPNRVTTRMKALTKLVEQYLGLPLFKGKVRTSNWSKPLKQEQIRYAAADAYAGVMLYHCMNARRLAMAPVPGIPLHAETYCTISGGMGPLKSVRLGEKSTDKDGITASEFYRSLLPPEDQANMAAGKTAPLEAAEEDEDMESEDVGEPNLDGEAQAEENIDLHLDGEETMELVAVGRVGRQLMLEEHKVRAQTTMPPPRPLSLVEGTLPTIATAPKAREPALVKKTSKPTGARAQAIFSRLSAHRKEVAGSRPPYVVAGNSLLADIAERCPNNEKELLKIRGIGPKKAELYGAAWLAIVRAFIEEDTIATADSEQPLAAPAPLPATPVPRRTQPLDKSDKRSGSQRRTPAVLHTGLSFSLENAKLETCEGGPSIITISDDSDDEESAFGSPMRSPSPSALKRKRDLLEAATQVQPMQRPVLPRPIHQPRRSVTRSAPTEAPIVAPAPIPVPIAAPALTPAPAPAPPRKTSDPMHPETRYPSTTVAKPPAPPTQIFSRQPLPPPSPQKRGPAEAQILRSKLMAFNRRITSVVVLQEVTIEHIIKKPPQTAQELLRIPHIMPFANACARQNHCLLTFIQKATQKTVASVA